MDNRHQHSDPANRLVVVLETNNQIQLAMAKGLLDHAAIPFFVQGQFATMCQNVDGFLHKWVRLQVPADRVAEAQEVLEPVQNPRPFLC